jgi:hypothetical protein
MSDFTITLKEAQDWATSWRTNPPKKLAKGHLISGTALSELLAIAGVVNVRAYMGVDDKGVQKLMLVGVDTQGKDLIDANHPVYDKTNPCPDICDPSSPLFTP